MKKILIYTASACVLMATPMLTSCQNEDLADVNIYGEKVLLTVTATRDSDATRATFAPEGGDLKCTWDAGDQLAVFNSDGNNLGTVTIKEGVNTSNGIFKGNVTVTDGATIYLVYTGKSNGFDKDNKLTIDLANQDGTFASFDQKDVMKANAIVELNEKKEATATATMSHMFAFGHFSLALPENMQLSKGDQLTISVAEGKTLRNGLTLTGIAEDYTEGNITVKMPEDGNSFYITMAANGDNEKLDPTFTIVKGGYTYTATPGAHSWKAGTYVRANANGDPVPVNEWTKKALPVDPNITDNWASVDDDDLDIIFSEPNFKFISDAEGWVTNVISLDYGGKKAGGWGTLYTYESNGIVGGLLSSTSDGGALFFQWGRWLGFPSSCVKTYFRNDDVYGSYPIKSQNLPGNPHNDLNIGYVGDNELMATFCSGYMGANSSFTRQKALNWSTMFAMITSAFIGDWDYIYANEECKWEDRSGNPCPDGYRVPTVAELEALIPSTGSVENSYAEVKPIGSEKFAKQWVVGSDEEGPYVTVKSVKTTKDKVSADDPIFNGIKPVKLQALGFINSGDRPATRQLNGQLGMYWSNESGKNTFSGTNGNGAKYLRVVFDSSTKVRLDIQVAPRTFGGCVLPIKDASAKSASITPWLPVNSNYKH